VLPIACTRGSSAFPFLPQQEKQGLSKQYYLEVNNIRYVCAQQAVPRARMSIVLTGMRGAGKSSLGVAVAAHLGRGFVDVDHHLEAQWGCKVIEVCQSDAAMLWPRGEVLLNCNGEHIPCARCRASCLPERCPLGRWANVHCKALRVVYRFAICWTILFLKSAV
jgi:hypothetical protein